VKAANIDIRTIAIATTLSILAVHTAVAQADETSRAWNKPVPPFPIIGNLYYVGASEVTSFLITTPQGHFLLDGGFVETAPQIERNIAELGFKLKDVKFLLNSHAHFDHAGGLAELKKLSGARLVASERDAPLLRAGGHGDFRFGDTLAFPAVAPDQLIHDGESIQIGDQKMTAHLTPGHTKGNTTWTTKISDGRKTYDVVFAGSPNFLDYQLAGHESYPGIAADFEKSYALLKTLPCDIFPSAHGSVFNFLEKRERLLRGETPNPFIDPHGYRQMIAEYEKKFRARKREQESKLNPL
jgi:metallo-beta-lactamase class B